jgi:hypothetical protein
LQVFDFWFFTKIFILQQCLNPSPNLNLFFGFGSSQKIRIISDWIHNTVIDKSLKILKLGFKNLNFVPKIHLKSCYKKAHSIVHFRAWPNITSEGRWTKKVLGKMSYFLTVSWDLNRLPRCWDRGSRLFWSSSTGINSFPFNI